MGSTVTETKDASELLSEALTENERLRAEITELNQRMAEAWKGRTRDEEEGGTRPAAQAEPPPLAARPPANDCQNRFH